MGIAGQSWRVALSKGQCAPSLQLQLTAILRLCGTAHMEKFKGMMVSGDC
jgi:hypothetical protein